MTLAGTGTGSVSSDPDGIDCPGDCSQSYLEGTVVSLSATPAAGSTFAGWSGDCSGTASCSVTMDAARSVTATFTLDPVFFSLNVTLAGTGTGSVSSDPDGIDCPGDCSQSYLEGTLVTLSATPAAGSSFAGWSGDCSGTASCSVTMDAARSVTATFDLLPVNHSLSVTLAGTGTGSVSSDPDGIDCPGDCSQSYLEGTLVTLTATPDEGSTFAGWSGDCSGTASCSVTMDAARSVTATFTLDPVFFSLNVTLAGNGTGGVSSDPGGIDCPGDCSQSYLEGTLVTLSATPAAGSSFAGWSGDCSGTASCSVTMDAARSVTATFTLDPVFFSLNVTLAGTAPAASAVTRPASTAPATAASTTSRTRWSPSAPRPATGSSFAGWSGDCSGTASCSVTMDAARSVTATFTLDPVFFSLNVTLAGNGTGSVSSDPAGIDCGIDCGEDYLEGTLVTLTATPGHRLHLRRLERRLQRHRQLQRDHGCRAQRDRHLHPGPGLLQPERDPGRRRQRQRQQ